MQIMMECLYKIPLFVMMAIWIRMSKADSLDVEQFALDIFGDPSAADFIRNPPNYAVGELKESCKDYSTSCIKYRNYCTHRVVLKFCKVTCKQCSNKPIPEKRKNCQDDTNSMCSVRKEQGMCETYKDVMNSYCPKTCGFCIPIDECSDLKAQEYCDIIRKKGFCSRENTIKLASKYCAKTCKACAKDLQCGTVKVKDVDSTVISGKTSTKGQWPWQVAIYYDKKFICGGSLISKNVILTAAHCVKFRKDLQKYKIVLGDYNRDYNEGTEQTRYVTRMAIHKDYDDIYEDIALIQINPNAVFTHFVVPVCLPEKDSKIAPGSKCYMTGWGKITHPGKSVPILQEARVPVVSYSECSRVNNRYGDKVTDKMLCAGEGFSFKGGCHGDSGGPFVCKNEKGSWELQGIMSWGSSDCNALEKYTVFTRVSRYINWIKENMS